MFSYYRLLKEKPYLRERERERERESVCVCVSVCVWAVVTDATRLLEGGSSEGRGSGGKEKEWRARISLALSVRNAAWKSGSEKSMRRSCERSSAR